MQGLCHHAQQRAGVQPGHPLQPGVLLLRLQRRQPGRPVWCRGPGRSLFAFGGTGTRSAYRGADEPARFYALNGDIIGLRTGEIITFASAPRAGETWYEAARPARIMAGRDIVNSGQLTGTLLSQFAGLATSTGNLFIHDDPTDISIVSAGRDILYSTFNVAGPGSLEISAGRNILMEDKAAVTSLGAIVPGDNRPGADIVMQAGVGSGPDYLAFAQRYLDPANRVEAGGSLVGGGVAKTYEVELAAWLAERFGFSGTSEEARAYYAALPAEQQRVFAREIYFAELRAGGREYNDEASPRFGSYLRAATPSPRCSPPTTWPATRSSTRATSRCTAAPGCTPTSAAASRCSPRAGNRCSASRARPRRPPPGSSPRARATSSCSPTVACCWARAAS